MDDVIRSLRLAGAEVGDWELAMGIRELTQGRFASESRARQDVLYGREQKSGAQVHST